MIKYFVITFFAFSLFEGTLQQDVGNDGGTSSSDTLNAANLSSDDLMKALEFLGNVFDGTAFTGQDDYHQQVRSYIISQLKNNPEFISKLESLKETLTPKMADNLQNEQYDTNEDLLESLNEIIAEP